MRWRKRGFVYAPDASRPWSRAYATLPTVEVRGDALRVYFAALDDRQRGRIGFVDVSARDPARILRESALPVFDLGERGLFDDCGVNPSCVVRVGAATWLYYIGWQRSEAVPYLLFSGLAVRGPDGRFVRYSPVPILDRIAGEPYLRSAMSVLVEDGGYRAWYVSGEGWEPIRDRLFPRYSIYGASSQDGIHWVSTGQPCVRIEGDEYGLGRPWVLRERDGYSMWYSIRSESRAYRIGYADSRDGASWQRRDSEEGLEVSPAGWDCEMTCYACVVDVDGQRLMFYNGNRHGATGFGWAVAEG